MGVHAILEEFSKSVSNEDWDRVATLLSARFFGYEPATGEPSARERIVPLLADLRRAVPDLAIEFKDVVADGELVRASFAMRGTHQNPLWGARGSGKLISWTNPVTMRLDDEGLALRFDDVGAPDLAALLRQFELVNPPDRMDAAPPHPVSLPEFLLRLVLTQQANDRPCAHLDQILVTQPETRVCSQCYAEGVGWPALRMCLTCGAVGCCDTSRKKHAMKHHKETGHPMIRSLRLDESWVWCYEDNAFFERKILERYPTP